MAALVIFAGFSAFACTFIAAFNFPAWVSRTIPNVVRQVIATFGSIAILIGGAVFIGALGRAEMSPWPWELGWSQGLLAYLIFYPWMFFIWGHLYAIHTLEDEGRLVFWPYAMNFLIGIILCMEGNFIYESIVWLSSRGGRHY